MFQSLPGASFIVNGALPVKDSALASAGAELRLANSVTLLSKFDAEFASRSNTYGHGHRTVYVVGGGVLGYLMASDPQVLVVGAGPAGLFMAAELNRHGVSCRIVDKNDGPTHESRAASIQARTLEILDTVSLAEEFVQAGNICHAAATYTSDTSDHKLIKYLTFDELDSAFPFVLQLPQSQTERILARYLARLGTEVERRVELVAFEQDEDGVRATLQPADGGQETAHVPYLIACDGAHSPVRHALGVSFSGGGYPTD